ncbi:U4/U6.U5 tri-snRNP-associated protein 1-like [Fukomys damarensis]|uniref:U4/U6.U5 tri-snRNP-associated protein 1-like n=1 Tax=Fukomys damarensis TaxID=885580 RepID=UPI0008FEF249|nr:U4/U6.U5 tri-snRNP-associated protein 1-like [Fukomys damarensis]
MCWAGRGGGGFADAAGKGTGLRQLRQLQQLCDGIEGGGGGGGDPEQKGHHRVQRYLRVVLHLAGDPSLQLAGNRQEQEVKDFEQHEEAQPMAASSRIEKRTLAGALSAWVRRSSSRISLPLPPSSRGGVHSEQRAGCCPAPVPEQRSAGDHSSEGGSVKAPNKSRPQLCTALRTRGHQQCSTASESMAASLRTSRRRLATSRTFTWSMWKGPAGSSHPRRPSNSCTTASIGKGWGEMKMEWRMKKLDKEALLKMGSSNTPLGRVALLQ